MFGIKGIIIMFAILYEEKIKPEIVSEILCADEIIGNKGAIIE
jgi:hypothetical protein